jgi:hypothetical protein
VGDQCSNGTKVGILENGKQYKWRVQMCNAKFGNNDNYWSAYSPEFRMNVNATSEVNDSGYSSVKVELKYYGQIEVLNKVVGSDVAAGKIRVEAFVSPDFTGEPVSRAFFNEANVESLTNDAAFVNAVLKGIPSGSYYLRAYIDTNGNFKKDEWESWGYACRRDLTTSKNIFTPVPVTVGPDVAHAPVARIYIEDVDTDGDWLPDAWEWTTSNGSLTAKGPGEFYDTNVFKIKDDLQKKFTRMSASGSKVSANLRALTSSSLITPDILVLLGGIDTTDFATSAGALDAAVSPDLVEAGVVIKSIIIENGKVNIDIDVETKLADVNAPGFYDVEYKQSLFVTCNIYRKSSLDEAEWKIISSTRIEVGVGTIGIPLEAGEVDPEAKGGFYRVEVLK